MNAPHPPPAGWYPDPSGRAPFRYWDGQQWTEHTNQGTAPNPSVAQHVPAAPAPPASPGYLGTPTAFGPAGGAPVAAPAGGGPITAQSFVEDLKKLEGYALVVVGALLFLIASFLPWVNTEVSGFDVNTGAPVTQEDSANAWDGEATWWIRGWEVTVQNVQQQNTDGGTDMIILLPLALIAAGVALAMRVGKQVTYGNEIVVGASALLAVLMIGEIIHINGAFDDAKDVLQQINGPNFDGSIGFGMYLAALAAIAMAVASGRALMAKKSQG